MVTVISAWPPAVILEVWRCLAGYSWAMIRDCVLIASLLLKIPLKDFEVIKTQFLTLPCDYSFIALLFLLLLDLLRDSGVLGSCVVNSFLSAENCSLSLWIFFRTGSSELCRACLTCRYWF